MSQEPKGLLERFKEISVLLQGAVAALILLTAIVGTLVTKHVLDPPVVPATTPSSANQPSITPPRWQQLKPDQVTIVTSTWYADNKSASVTINGSGYADATSSELTTTEIITAEDPAHVDVGFALSKRYSEFKVVFGIPDNAPCCPMPVLSYSIDGGASSTPVTLSLAHPDPIDLPVTGVIRLDVRLEFTGGWKAAFGGAEGLSISG